LAAISSNSLVVHHFLKGGVESGQASQQRFRQSSFRRGHADRDTRRDESGAVRLSGIELAHRIRKRQFLCQPTDRREPLNLRAAWFAAVMV
jgi:hypothetical protein